MYKIFTAICFLLIWVSSYGQFVGIGTTIPTMPLTVVNPGTSVNTALFTSSNAVEGNESGVVYARSDFAGNKDVVAVQGSAIATAPGYGYGGMFRGNYIGVFGVAQSPFTSFNAFGVRGEARSSTTGIGYGVYGVAINSNFNFGLYCAGNGSYTGTWTMLSDAKFKTGVTPVTDDALSLIKRLRPVTYRLKTKEFPSLNFPEGMQYGFIAQELQTVLPTLVEKGAHPGETKESAQIDYLAVNYIGLVPVLTKAIQLQDEKIKTLEALVQLMDERLKKLENK